MIGLPEKGEVYALAPVDAFKEYQSPFGLLDTVGNAGDWVIPKARIHAHLQEATTG